MRPVPTFCPLSYRRRVLLVLLSATSAMPLASVFAQPSLTGVDPARNALNVPATANPTFGFDYRVNNNAATLGSVKVFSQQRGGRMQHLAGGTTTYANRPIGGGGGIFERGSVHPASAPTTAITVSEITTETHLGVLKFDPAINFRPGETIFTTVTTAVEDYLGEGNMTRPWVQQFTAAAGVGPGTFYPGSDPSVGNGPLSVTTGDVDNDGDLDLLTANFTANTVSVRFNNGSGTFSGSTNVNVGASPRSVTVADMDGDGDLDLLTANAGDNTVSVRFNRGNGAFFDGFSVSQEVRVGAAPRSVAVGDVDGDGDLDLVTGNFGLDGLGSTVSVRFNNGVGSFEGPGPFSGGTDPAVGAAPWGVALGDVDNDGDLDILAANTNDNTVSVRLNNGSGAFSGSTNVPVDKYPVSVKMGDVDGDGDLDLVTANRGRNLVTIDLDDGNTVSVRLNNGTGLFSGGAEVGVGRDPESVALGDVDGDGDLDLVTGNTRDLTASVRLNNGGTFSSGSEPEAGRGSSSVALGDVDGDGDLDLLTCSSVTNTASVRRNQSLPPTVTGLSPTRNLRNAPRAASVAVTFSQVLSTSAATQGAIKVFSQQRGGQMRDAQGGAASVSGNTISFDPTTDFRPGETVLTTVTTAARSSSGAEQTNGHVHQFTAAAGVGPGTFSGGSDPGVGSGPQSVAVGDVDSDGDLDLVTANFNAGTVSVRLNNGGTFSGGSDPRVGSGPVSVALGDVDGDSDLDIVTVNLFEDQGGVRVLLNNGSGSFAFGASVEVGPSPQSVALGDVDGDGDLDLLTANYNAVATGTSSGTGAGTTVSVRLNNGAGLFSGGSDPSVGTGPQSVAVGDVDGDGDLDLVTANHTANTVSVRLNNGSGIFGSGSDAAVGIGPSSVALGDVDGDGDLDLLTANSSSSTVSVRLNNGLGSFSGSTSVAVGTNPVSVTLGDVDGDGDLDLLTANQSASTVSVRLNNSGSFGGSTNVNVGTAPRIVALGDVDGDGDLDLLTTRFTVNTNTSPSASSVSVRLNQPVNVPTLTSLSPTTGVEGTSVTLTGTNFTGATGISFNGTSATTLSVSGATTATATVPAGTTTGNVTITTPNGTSNGVNFTLTPSLRSLVLSAGSLSPDFASGTTSYVLTVPGTTTSTTVTPTNAQAPGGSITVNGTSVASGTASGAIALSPGSNTITVVVDPVGTGAATTYTVALTRTPCVVTALTQPVTLQLNASGTASLLAAAVNNGSSSSCGGVTLSVSPSAFTCANRGANTVTLTVTDALGTVATAVATVTVVDALAPSITAPAAVTRGTDAGLCTAARGTWLGTATVTDNCSAVVANDAPAIFPLGTTTVTWTATDPDGSTATAQQLVTVADTEKPVVRTHAPTIQLDAAGTATLMAAQLNNGSSDNCGIASVALNKTTFDCTNTGSNTVTLTVTDVHGNVQTGTATVTVEDQVAPVVRTQNLVLQLSSSGAAATTAAAVNSGSTDNCGIRSVALSKTAFGCADLGPNTVTLIVTDNSGNVSTGPATVTVVDLVAPTASCQNIEVYLAPTGGVTITPAQVNNGSADNCTLPANLGLALNTTSFTAASATPYPITLTVTDASSNASTCSATVLVKKRPATLVYSGHVRGQYSDHITLTAHLRDGNTNTGLAGRQITFALGSQRASAPTDANGVATTTLRLTQAPSAYTLASTFAGDDIYEAGSDTDPFELQKEDARVTFTGALFSSTASATSGQATVTLSATVQDISAVTTADDQPGDIRNATVTFINRETGATLAANVPVGLVSLNDLRTGTATASWSTDIGNNNSLTYSVGVIVNHYYTRDNSADNALLTVSKPLNDFVTGGGYVLLTASAGQKAGDVGSRHNFGFSIKYNKSGKTLQGSVHTFVRRTEADGRLRVYQIKGNVMTSLAVQPATATAPARATFNGKASIQDITNPRAPIAVDGNATLQVTMTDTGGPGTQDLIGITVWNKDGGLWVASDWSGTKTTEKLLASGNLVVRGGAYSLRESSSPAAVRSTAEATTEIHHLELYPNPTSGTATLTGTAPGTVVRVYDAVGREVTTATTAPNGTTALMLPAGRATGVYLVRAGATALRLIVE